MQNIVVYFNINLTNDVSYIFNTFIEILFENADYTFKTQYTFAVQITCGIFYWSESDFFKFRKLFSFSQI